MGFPGLPTDHVWHSLGKWGWANVDWCEATLMGYVTEPANTFSNLAYVLMGIYFLTKYRSEHKLLKIYPLAVIALGFLSGFYHATNAWVTQLGDFIGMYLVASIPLLLNLEKLGMKEASQIKTYITFNLLLPVLTVIGYMINFPIQLMIVVFFAGVILTEFMLIKSSPLENYKNLLFTLGSFAVAITFSALDASRTMCDPHNHVIQGHALWHVFSSIGLYFAYEYSVQISKRPLELYPMA